MNSPALARRAPLLAAPAIIHMSAYANTLTRLIPDLYAALNVVSRELVGFIPGVDRNASAERAAVGQTIVWPIAPAQSSQSVVPAMAIPEPPDNTIDYGTMTITTFESVAFGWTGEEQRGLNANGPGYLSIQGQLFAEGLRTLVNKVEVAIATEAANNASRAYGTVGTIPFSDDKLTAAAQVRKILDDNGAPLTGRSVVIDTTVGATMRTVYQLTRANEAGTTMTLRDGQLLDIHNMSFRESAGVVRKTAGTAAAATTNAAGYAVGARTITLASAGTGTILAGDIITFAGDTNKYQVETGDADVSGGGTIVLQKPGLRVAIPTAATLITMIATSTRNVAFSSDAIRLAFRAPAIPVEGDARIDSLVLTDMRSGLAFEVSIWPGYRKVRAEVAAVWGTKAIKSNHIAALIY